MIHSILRSTLVLTTVLVSAAALDNAANPGTKVEAASLPPLPVQPAPRNITPTLKSVLVLNGLQRVEAHFPRFQSQARFRNHFSLRNITSGLATWYGQVRDGHRTANGEFFDCTLMTAANNTLPFGTRVRVTNLKTGMSVVVRVNDRGVLNPGNIIDLTSAAADRIGMLRMGIAPVHLDVLAGAA
jgi:rare lipoprotein A (peptidoglycan hydrolase)